MEKTEHKFTDEEIKKALECHTKRRCWDNCPNAAEERQRLNRPCSQMIAEDALDLINRQREEIESLNEQERILIYQLAFEREKAIKEFAERVKKYFSANHSPLLSKLMADKIDTFVKEMTEEQQ